MNRHSVQSLVIKRFFEKIQKNSASLHIGHVQYIKAQYLLGGNCAFITYTGLMLFQNESIGGAAPILAITGFLFDQPCFDKIVQGTLDGAAGKLQISGDGVHGRPAVRSPSRTILQIHINGSRPMRKLIGRGSIDGIEITHGYSPYVLSMDLRRDAFSCASSTGVWSAPIPPRASRDSSESSSSCTVKQARCLRTIFSSKVCLSA